VKLQNCLCFAQRWLPHSTGYWYLSSIKYPGIIQEFEMFMEENKVKIEEMKKRYNFYLK